jgi:hypothetical protein
MSIWSRLRSLEDCQRIDKQSRKSFALVVNTHADAIEALEVVAKRADAGVGILTGSTEEAVHRLQERIEALEKRTDVSAAVRMLETELERRRDWKATYNAFTTGRLAMCAAADGEPWYDSEKIHNAASAYADRAHGPLERDDSAELAAYERERDQLRAELQLEHAKNNAWHKRGEVLQAEVERLRAETLAAWTEGTLAADKAMGESLAAAKASCAEMARSESIAKTQLRELREAAEALNQYITEQEDAEWVSFACLDVKRPVVVQFRAVLAKVSR